MVQISIAVTMIKNAVEIMDAIHALEKHTTPVAPTAVSTPTSDADIPEYEACSCGFDVCCPISEPTESSTTSAATTVMSHVDTPVFEACPSEDSERCLRGDVAPAVVECDWPMHERTKRDVSELMIVAPDSEKEEVAEENETSEDQDRLDEMVAALGNDEEEVTTAAPLEEPITGSGALRLVKAFGFYGDARRVRFRNVLSLAHAMMAVMKKTLPKSMRAMCSW